jgi:hypothetical protein
MNYKEDKEFVANFATGVKPDTLVLTDKGYKQIKDIVIGDNVFIFSGYYSEVVEVNISNFCGHLILFKYRDVYNKNRELCVGTHHTMFVYDNEDKIFKWKKALKIGLYDCLIYPGSKYELSSPDAIIKNIYEGDLYNLKFNYNSAYLVNNVFIESRIIIFDSLIVENK